jgi:hypothetical protein
VLLPAKFLKPIVNHVNRERRFAGWTSEEYESLAIRGDIVTGLS